MTLEMARALFILGANTWLCDVVEKHRKPQNRVAVNQADRMSDMPVNVVAVVLVFLVGLAHERGVRIRERIAALPVAGRWAVYMGAVLLVVIFGAYGPGFGEIDFIYAGF